MYFRHSLWFDNFPRFKRKSGEWFLVHKLRYAKDKVRIQNSYFSTALIQHGDKFCVCQIDRFSLVYKTEKKIVRCWVIYCVRRILFGENLNSLLPKKTQGRCLKYYLNILNLVYLCGLLYVLFQYRLEQLEFTLQRAHGPLHVNKNLLDSFQRSQLGNLLCAVEYTICFSVKFYLFFCKCIHFIKRNWNTDVSSLKCLWSASNL